MELYINLPGMFFNKNLVDICIYFTNSQADNGLRVVCFSKCAYYSIMEYYILIGLPNHVAWENVQEYEKETYPLEVQKEMCQLWQDRNARKELNLSEDKPDAHWI